ncbi:ATP-binding protein [Marinobacter bryozoorum]|uniref:ATP-binding protein n=1 Tax=Marinobacter bryozoorum TaxID=256324 RepID=UPI002003F4F8|nr:ATP-binding protein [Marinobacter bryozoorum]MCK7543093.1 ATP-binding protein [Marinobacter bryozoorum]
MRQRTAKRSLANQLLLLGALPAVLMFIGLMVFFTHARLTDARQELFDSTQVLVDNLAPAMEYAVVSGNLEVLEDLLSQASSRTSLEWIRVTDVVGNQMAFVGSERFSEWPGADQQQEGIHRFSSDILQLPVTLGSASEDWFEPDYRVSGGAMRVGTVEVAVSEQRLTERRGDILLTSGVVGISLLVFALLLIYRLTATLLEPMQTLADRVMAMTRRDYRESPPVGTRVAEFAQLEDNLNQLARNLGNLQESRDQTLALSESAREKAEQASQAKTEFLAVMSHELRTPLNGMLAMVDLVSEQPLTGRQADYLNTARRSTEDLLTLINDILDVSRLDQGTLLLQSRPFNPRELAENCMASFRHAAEQHGLQLALELSGNWPDEPEVAGDAVRYRQVLANLLDNAIKFSDQGVIRVTMDWHLEADDCVFITCEVEDNGHGIAPEQLEQVFNSFEQLDSSHSRTTDGTGIGLTLVQKLVELMGGHISLASDFQEGSSFRFEVPFELIRHAQGSQPESPQGQPTPQEGVERQTPRALVVEDNPVNQRVARTLLDRLGFDTAAVTNGREAVESVTCTDTPFTVILMDCHMPVMDGFAAAQAIREWERQEEQHQIPIIALTADALPGTEKSCLEAGMNDYLSKPVRKEQLRSVLSRWVPL